MNYPFDLRWESFEFSGVYFMCIQNYTCLVSFKAQNKFLLILVNCPFLVSGVGFGWIFPIFHAKMSFWSQFCCYSLSTIRACRLRKTYKYLKEIQVNTCFQICFCWEKITYKLMHMLDRVYDKVMLRISTFLWIMF